MSIQTTKAIPKDITTSLGSACIITSADVPTGYFSATRATL